MHKANSHGAGFAFRKEMGKGSWEVAKGFMTIEEILILWEEIKEFDEIIGHFRLATHGSITAFNCHPFAIADTLDESVNMNPKGGLKALFFHNGILHEFGSKSVSDSADFCVKVVSKVPEHAVRSVLKSVTGKFAYIGTDGKVILAGDFTDWKKGIKVSNTYWDKTPVYTGIQYNAATRTYHGGGGSVHHSGNHFTNNNRGKVDDDREKWWNDSRYAGNEDDLTLGCGEIAGGQSIEGCHSIMDDDCEAYPFTEPRDNVMYKEYRRLCDQYQELTELLNMSDPVTDADDVKKWTKELQACEDSITDIVENSSEELYEVMAIEEEMEAHDPQDREIEITEEDETGEPLSSTEAVEAQPVEAQATKQIGFVHETKPSGMVAVEISKIRMQDPTLDSTEVS